MASQNHFLVDMWKCDLIGQLVHRLKKEHYGGNTKIRKFFLQIDTTVMCEEFQQLVELSMLGLKIWNRDNKCFLEFPFPSVSSSALDSRYESLVPANRRRVNQVTSCGRITAAALYQELSKPIIDEHFLVDPYNYGELLGPVADAAQPYRIVVHPQVGFICDVHSHLSNAEVIGLLAGRWAPEENCLYIQAPFPCTATDRAHDMGYTDVELDPEAEWTVRQTIEAMGMKVVGWYHSHPQFKPNPSVTDIFNQQQYQTYTRDEVTGVEAFVGLIISTYDSQLTSAAAHHQWFTVVNHSPDAAKQQPLYMPVRMEVQYYSFDLKSFYEKFGYSSADGSDDANDANGNDGHEYAAAEWLCRASGYVSVDEDYFNILSQALNEVALAPAPDYLQNGSAVAVAEEEEERQKHVSEINIGKKKKDNSRQKCEKDINNESQVDSFNAAGLVEDHDLLPVAAVDVSSSNATVAPLPDLVVREPNQEAGSANPPLLPVPDLFETAPPTTNAANATAATATTVSFIPTKKRIEDVSIEDKGGSMSHIEGPAIVSSIDAPKLAFSDPQHLSGEVSLSVADEQYGDFGPKSSTGVTAELQQHEAILMPQGQQCDAQPPPPQQQSLPADLLSTGVDATVVAVVPVLPTNHAAEATVAVAAAAVEAFPVEATGIDSSASGQRRSGRSGKKREVYGDFVDPDDVDRNSFHERIKPVKNKPTQALSILGPVKPSRGRPRAAVAVSQWGSVVEEVEQRRAMSKGDDGQRQGADRSQQSGDGQDTSRTTGASKHKRSGKRNTSNTQIQQQEGATVGDTAAATAGNHTTSGRRKRKKGNQDAGEDDNALNTVNLVAPPNGKRNSKSTAGKEAKSVAQAPTDTIFTSLILALRDGEKRSAEIGRQMLFAIAPPFRGIVLVLISLGFYYSRSPRRVDFNKKWKGRLKIDKIKASAEVWMPRLGIRAIDASIFDGGGEISSSSSSSSSSVAVALNGDVENAPANQALTTATSSYRILDDLILFLSCCWEDFSSKSRPSR